MSTYGSNFARDLDWNLLKIFRQIVHAGGISRAAREHSRKQPAVSLALRRLEERLGVRLCQRGARGFRLTEEGQGVSEICNQMERLVSEIPTHVDDASDEVKGRIRLQAISNIVDTTLDESILGESTMGESMMSQGAPDSPRGLGQIEADARTNSAATPLGRSER